jgi:hypothetical protein
MHGVTAPMRYARADIGSLQWANGVKVFLSNPKLMALQGFALVTFHERA